MLLSLFLLYMITDNVGYHMDFRQSYALHPMEDNSKFQTYYYEDDLREWKMLKQNHNCTDTSSDLRNAIVSFKNLGYGKDEYESHVEPISIDLTCLYEDEMIDSCVNL